MAIQDRSLVSAEHDWYAIRSGAPGNAPLTQHKFGYYASKSIPKGPLTQMERQWLQGVGSTTAIGTFELWLRACQAQTVEVGKSVNECKMNFFTTVASGVNP